MSTFDWADDFEEEERIRQANASAAPEEHPAASPEPEQEPQPEPVKKEIDPEEQFTIPRSGPFRMFMGNLAYKTTDKDISKWLADRGCSVVHVQIAADRDTGKPKGFAHVEFENRESLIAALKHKGEEFNGRSLNLDVAEASSRAPRSSNRGGGRGGGRRTGSREPHHNEKGRDSYRRPNQFPSSKKEELPSKSESKPFTILVKDSQKNPPAASTASTDDSAAPKKKANPFGAARPREEVLASRGGKADSSKSSEAVKSPTVEAEDGARKNEAEDGALSPSETNKNFSSRGRYAPGPRRGSSRAGDSSSKSYKRGGKHSNQGQIRKGPAKPKEADQKPTTALSVNPFSLLGQDEPSEEEE